MNENYEGKTIEEINELVYRKIMIRNRLEALSQDLVQAMAGEIVPDLDSRKAEFVALHNELRAMEGKEPRRIVGGAE